MTDVPTLTLPSGDELPQIGFGTWNIEGETLESGLRAALDTGYAHVDTAEGYKNEAEIGEVLAEYDRDDVFLTSKVLAKNLNYDSLLGSCRDSLDRLGTDYLDLYLIHWPNPAISLRESLDAMATLHDEGLVRNVGVSNFSAYQLSCAHHVSDVPIAVNQIEFHPWFQRPNLVEYCRETDTVVEAAAPLARTDVVLEDLGASERCRRLDHGVRLATVLDEVRSLEPRVELDLANGDGHVRDVVGATELEGTEVRNPDVPDFPPVV